MIFLLIILLATIDPPNPQWLDERRAVVTWSQPASDLVCLSKRDPFNRWIFLGCTPGHAGAHQVVLGEPGGDAAYLPEPGDRYWIDLYQGERWIGRSGVGELGARPMRLWLPLIIQPPPAN